MVLVLTVQLKWLSKYSSYNDLQRVEKKKSFGANLPFWFIHPHLSQPGIKEAFFLQKFKITLLKFPGCINVIKTVFWPV